MAHFTCNFLSYTLNRAINIDVIIPGVTSTEAEQSDVTHRMKYKYPVLYLLHGYCNDYSTWERYTSIERYAEERRIAIVTFSAENSMYVNVGKFTGCEDPSGWIVAPDYEKLLLKELPDFVTSMFPVTENPKDTYLAGLSMGGYGSMCNGFRNPERFCAIGAFSPLTTIGTLSEDGKEKNPIVPENLYNYEPELLIRKAVLAKEQGKIKTLPSLYYCYGTEDFLKKKQDWFSEVLQNEFSEKLKIEQEILFGYGHEWAFWDLEVRKFLDWIPRTDEYYLEQPIRRI